MAITTQTLPLPYGATLVFHFDDSYPQIEQVGTLDYYQAIVNQLVYQSLEYYSQGAVNLFLKHVTLHVYADFIPYVDAPGGTDALTAGFWTYDDGAGNSHINAHWLDVNQASNAYRFPASLSHEFGHAYHNWCGWRRDPNWGAVIAAFWTSEVVGNQSFPAGWNLFEAWANAYRCLKGVACTRGISGPTLNGGTDPCPAPMQDPNNHPEWRKQFDLLPELCGYMARYGCTTGSLAWSGGTNGSWTFTDLAGNNVALTRLGNGWEKWGWSWWPFGWGWQAFDPQYDRV
jgi:hypothetical protein